MKIKRMELNNFKRFTHLIVENIPESAKLVILVGPNGSGKTSFMEAINHYRKCTGYNNTGDFHYVSKTGNTDNYDNAEWYCRALKLVDIDFYDKTFPKDIGNNRELGSIFISGLPIEMSRISR